MIHQLVLLPFLVQTLVFLGIAASSPILKYGAQYAQMGRAHMSFVDSSESSSGYCLFQRVPGQELKRWPKVHLRQTHPVLAVKAPRLPSLSTRRSRPRASAGGARPLTFGQSPWPDYWPSRRRTAAVLTHASPLDPDSVVPGSAFPEITTEPPWLVPLATTQEPRGDA